MFIRLSAAIAALGLLTGAALAQGAKPTDPQIAHIAYTAGVIDIAAAKQAIEKADNKDVKAFAEDMVRDHEAVNKQALDLVKKLKVTPTRPMSPTRSPTTRPSTARWRRS
jgi:putative membrane protein